MLLENLLILGGLVHLEVRQVLAALRDFAKKPAARGVILFVTLQMVGEKFNLLGEQRDLHLRRARILFVKAAFLNDLLLLRAFQGHRKGGDEQNFEPADCMLFPAEIK
jgi:hypothetical protein